MIKSIKATLQYFYHGVGEKLPIRDVLNTQHQGFKTEPHYENLTENWCSKCMNARIKGTNRNNLDYLLLFTKYHKTGHKYDGKYLIVGYYKRADPKRWIKLSKSIQSDAELYDPNNPKECGFFAGDEKESKFVSAEDAYLLNENIENARHFDWYINDTMFENIMGQLRYKKNILPDLIKRVNVLTKNDKNKTNECRSSSRRCR